MNTFKKHFPFEISQFSLETSSLSNQKLLERDSEGMDLIELRIIDWLESREIEMIDPEERKKKFFMEKKISIGQSPLLKNFSLEASPLFRRHKNSFSPSTKPSYPINRDVFEDRKSSLDSRDSLEVATWKKEFKEEELERNCSIFKRKMSKIPTSLG